MNFGNESYENLTPHTKIKNMRNRMFISEFISLQVSPSDRASELGFGLRKSPFLKSAPSHARRHLSKRILPAGAPKNARKRGKGERKRETRTNTNRRTLRRRSAWETDGVMHTPLLCLETFTLSLSKFVYVERFLN